MTKYRDFIQAKKEKLSQLQRLINNWEEIDPKKVSDNQIKRMTESISYHSAYRDGLDHKLFWELKAVDNRNAHKLWYATNAKMGFRKMTQEEYTYLKYTPTKQIKKDLKSRKPNMAKKIIESFNNRNKETYHK